MKLINKIDDFSAVIEVIGLGYVGLPLLLSFAKKSYNCIGLDTDKVKIRDLDIGKSYITSISDEQLKSINSMCSLEYTSNYDSIRDADIVIICVPTPLDSIREPCLNYLIDAAKKTAFNMKNEALIVFESTTYPGTTQEILIPLMEKYSGKKAGEDFFVAYSPERIDPGNKQYDLSNTPKIVSGIDNTSLELVTFLYRRIIQDIVKVSDTKTAEITKIVENAYRSINIAFANELAMVCSTLSIDVWEVIDAASTKPYGFIPFYPGPGVGGHCIPIDPIYLSWKLRQYNKTFSLIDVADNINKRMPEFVVSKIDSLLESKKKEETNLLLLGVSYKKDVNDIRESPAIEVIKILEKKKYNFEYNDPYIEEINIGENRYKSTQITESKIKKSDAVILLTDHSKYNYNSIFVNAKLILDTKNAFKGLQGNHLIKI